MKQFLENFQNLLENYGEIYFSRGNKKEDYEYITGVIKHQGYWSGDRYRFYYDNELNYLNAKERF